MHARESRDYLEITARTINIFSRRGRMDLDAFNEIMEIALRDNVVDDNEKRVLGNIISMLRPHELTDELSERVAEVRMAYGIA